MKTKRFLLAAALTIAAACTGEPTAPEPAIRGPGAVPASTSTSETAEPTTSTPVAEPAADDGGSFGSGCCANR